MASKRKTGAGSTAPARRKQVRLTPAQREQGGEGTLNKHWRTYFLQELAQTSNVTLSAERAGVSPSRAYKARREHADFAAQWRAALLEGYDHLEMELLGYLRDPKPERKMDVAAAQRLLAAHRQEVARQRALESEEDEQAVLDSIDAMIDQMRERAAANAAIIAETAMDNPDEDR